MEALKRKIMSGGLARIRYGRRALRGQIGSDSQQIHAPRIRDALTTPLGNRLRRHTAKPRNLCGSAQFVDQEYGLWIAHARYGNHSYRKKANHSYERPCNAPEMERINNRIKRLRDQAGMSQGALARAVGVSRPAVSKWENGDTENLKLANLIKLCQIFRLSADELIAGELAVEKPVVAPTPLVNETRAEYSVERTYRMPDHLAALCGTLSDDGRRLVEAQIEVAIETAQRMYGSRDSGQQNAA